MTTYTIYWPQALRKGKNDSIAFCQGFILYRLRYLLLIKSSLLNFFHLCALNFCDPCIAFNKEFENFMRKKEKKNSICGERRRNNAHIPLPERGCVEARLNSCSITPFAPSPSRLSKFCQKNIFPFRPTAAAR